MKVLVVGAGGMGWHLSLALASHRRHDITVCDNDEVEGSGGARLCVPEEWRGMKKTEALSLMDSRIDYVIGKVPPVPGAYDVVIDATDMGDRTELKKAITETGAEYIRASYDVIGGVLYVSVTKGVGFGKMGGYTNEVLRSHAMVAGGICALIIDMYLMKQIELPYSFTFPAEL